MAELGAKSEKLNESARALMPGGVSSPVRSFTAVGTHPFFVAKGAGAILTDVDGNEYIDYVQSWGALLFGHARGEIVDAVSETARKGTSFGTPSELEVELARLVVDMIPNVDKVRFVSSGTEAATTALRLARGATGRDKILKFAGCYHGHVDSLLAEAGSGVATLGIPGSPGVPPGAVADTIVAPYNDLDAARDSVQDAAEDLAAIIVEPVAANMGLVVQRDGYLEGLRTLADDLGALLILDEVITGFRLERGGAQERFGIKADLVMLGKILGGGLPVGAVAGSAELMDRLAPDGPVYQAGTLSGNPLAMAAGIAALGLIAADPGLHDRLQIKARDLVRGLIGAAEGAEREPMYGAAVGALAGIFFADDEVLDLEASRATDAETYARFFREMLARGIYLPPSRFEALFLSDAHSDQHIEKTIEAAADVLATL